MQPESRIDEFLKQSEALAQETAERAPQEPPGKIVLSDAEASLVDTLSIGPESARSARVHAEARVEYGVVPGASEAAFGVISDSLTSDGWVKSPGREIDGRVTEHFRRTIDGDKWLIRVWWTRPAPDYYQNIEIDVRSPATVKGDHSVSS